MKEKQHEQQVGSIFSYFRQTMRIMRLSLFFMVVSTAIAFSATTYSQSTKLSVNLRDATVREVMEAIEEQSEFLFLYQEGQVDLDRRVTIHAEGKQLQEILDEVFKGTDNIYIVSDRQVVIGKAPRKTLEAQLAALQKDMKVSLIHQQQKEITGKVADSSGEPLPGATVMVKGTTIGTVTDVDGNFTLQIPSDAKTLQVSFVGMKTQEIPIAGRTTFNVVLEEESEALEEVVVTAFGTGQKKVSMVGSVQTVDPGQLRVPSASLSTSFAGRLAGVISYQRTGQPGADGASFYIRGISTISGATSPLIILDGVEISSGDLNTLDPEIIEEFSILKDATATAMYGSRGANGVMIIKTKSGADLKKPIINFRVEGNVAMPTSKIKLADGVTYMRLFNEAVDNLGTALKYSDDKIYGTEHGLNEYVYPNVNWYDEIFNDQAFNQKFNFNIRGGGKKADYFSSFSATHETGFIRNRSKDFFSFDNNIEVMRYNFQNNVNAYLGESSKFSLRLNVNLMDKSGPYTSVGGIYNSIMDINPVDFPIMYPDDPTFAYIRWGGFAAGNLPAYNPFAQLVSGYEDQFTSTVVANVQFDQGLDFITKGLSFSGLVSFKNWSSTTTYRSAPYNMFQLTNYRRFPDNTVDYTLGLVGSEQNPILNTTGGTTGDRWFYLQANLNWSRTFGKHDLNTLLIYNQDQFNLNNIAADTSIDRLYNSLPKRTQSIAGRLSYAYDDKYLAEFNFGYNGSENFAKGKRFGFFPSFALGYNISMEPFFESLLPVISYLKIRGSYGLVGNDKIGAQRFAYLPSIDLTGTGFTTGINQDYSMSGPVYNRYANYDLTWETGKKFNVGFDLHLFKDWKIVADFFRENRSNIFQQRGTIPTYLGTANTVVYANTAAVRNQGFDFSIDYGKQFSKDLIVQLKGTFSYAHNKITKYDEPSDQLYPNLMNVGYPLNTHLGYVADGLFIDWDEIANRAEQQISGNVAPGDIKYKDIPDRDGNTDGLITSNDRVRMGYPTVPEIIYGFGPNIRYKKFDFGFLLQGAARTSMMLSGMHPFGTNSRKNVMKWIVDSHWSPDYQDLYADYPRLTQSDHANNTVASNFWLRDASFLKLKNAEIGYNYKNMRFYLNGTNLLTFSKFKLWDPEMGGGSGLKYPTTRVFNVGFQMTIN
jgi:TonB-linked SusC/RagA family outer membrane protein